MTIVSINPADQGQIKFFTSMAEAKKEAGEGFKSYSTPEELAADTTVKASMMITLYNRNSSRLIKEFKSRAVAAARIFRDAPVVETAKKGMTIAQAALKVAKAKARAEANEAKAKAKFEAAKPKAEKRVRPSMFTGKKIFPAKKLLSSEGIWMNPRRNKNGKGTQPWGFKSMEMIIANPGMTYDDYRKAGGRYNDLAWDLFHGNVTLK